MRKVRGERGILSRKDTLNLEVSLYNELDAYQRVTFGEISPHLLDDLLVSHHSPYEPQTDRELYELLIAYLITKLAKHLAYGDLKLPQELILSILYCLRTLSACWWFRCHHLFGLFFCNRLS